MRDNLRRKGNEKMKTRGLKSTERAAEKTNNNTKCRSCGHNQRYCRGKKEGKGGVAPAIGAFHTGS